MIFPSHYFCRRIKTRLSRCTISSVSYLSVPFDSIQHCLCYLISTSSRYNFLVLLFLLLQSSSEVKIMKSWSQYYTICRKYRIFWKTDSLNCEITNKRKIKRENVRNGSNTMSNGTGKLTLISSMYRYSSISFIE